MWGIFFLFLFGFGSVFANKTRIGFGISLLRFGLDIIVIYYLCNSWVVTLQQIYCYVEWAVYHQTLILQLIKILYAKLRFVGVFKTFSSAHWMQIKLFFSLLIRIGDWTLFLGKPSELMSNFWTVRFLKLNMNRFHFFAHPYLSALVTLTLSR